MSSTGVPLAAVVGAGPAGLMAAEVLAEAGLRVEVFDAMPSAGRKFLLAGKGGLNLTHSEDFERFAARYAERAPWLAPLLRDLGADALRVWARGLGVETFVGSSGRVFPVDMKAAPLLRGWLHRLRAAGVVFHMRHRCTGIGSAPMALHFDDPQGATEVRPVVVVLAMGGASWARLGSDGAWVPWLRERGVDIAPLVPSNCGFEARWSEHLRTRFAGAPLKGVAAEWLDPADGRTHRQAGEFVISGYGVEGSLVYAASAGLRRQLAAGGSATLRIDLLPGRSLEWVEREIAHPRGTRSLSSHLKSRLGIEGAKAALLHERVPKADLADPRRLAAHVKGVALELLAARPIDEAISSAGGVRAEALDEHLMLEALPGVFCAGEMLDWEAPTGGYLLTACFATGRAAGQGAVRWLGHRAP
jgi:uncharacterized flavoprotein (TIGR03862 family)